MKVTGLPARHLGKRSTEKVALDGVADGEVLQCCTAVVDQGTPLLPVRAVDLGPMGKLASLADGCLNRIEKTRSFAEVRPWPARWRIGGWLLGDGCRCS